MGGARSEPTAFDEFARVARPRLLRALAASRGSEADDAAAEALAFAWEHWGEVRAMTNPVGYLYRVAQSRTRSRKPPRLPTPDLLSVPEVEPQLVVAMLKLPLTQRTAVWLVHGCQWRYGEVAEAMGTSVSMVGNHVTRGLAKLRQELEVPARA